ncbi:MAG: MFS transporter [Chloroflexia bacterium]|nr:MFS transporter [Chloroflexia bacterium]
MIAVNDRSTTSRNHPSIWDKEHFSITIGSILAFTIIAFQGLALATIAPVLAEDIGGRNLYGWIFSAFLLPQIVGTVYAGREVDRHSPARVFLIHLVFFTLGCIVAGAAPSISWLFLGRAIQGFGAGGIASCVYAVVSSAYEDKLRPAILAATSAAWVVPSLIGPAIAGFVAEQWSWRWAFFGLIPILLAIAPLTLPSYARIKPHNLTAKADRRLQLAIVLAIATGLFLAGLEIRPWIAGAAVAAMGLGGLITTLTRLLPEGTFTARPVMPAAILARGLGLGGFAVVETYLIFSLKDFGGVSATRVGLILTVTSILWTVGSWLQSRWDRATGPAHRPRRLATGFALVFAAALGIFLCVAILQEIWLWAGLVGWGIAGIGIGLAYPTAVSIAFVNAPAGMEGKVSSSMILIDLFAFSIGVGLGGVLLAFAESTGRSTELGAALAMSLGVAMLALAVVAGLRTRHLPVTSPSPSG